jgi:hypothetical protein
VALKRLNQPGTMMPHRQEESIPSHAPDGAGDFGNAPLVMRCRYADRLGITSVRMRWAYSGLRIH